MENEEGILFYKRIKQTLNNYFFFSLKGLFIPLGNLSSGWCPLALCSVPSEFGSLFSAVIFIFCSVPSFYSWLKEWKKRADWEEKRNRKGEKEDTEHEGAETIKNYIASLC